MGSPEAETHWSVRTLSKATGVGRETVRAVLLEANLRPHRLGTFTSSNDPEFREKLIDGVGLYTDPSKNAIVLLHGFSGSTKDWANQMKALSPQYRVIAIDERGHGKSASPKREEEYLTPVIAGDVLAVLNKLGIKRCCLGGHSMGGPVVLHFALEHPDMVAGLILVDTSSGFTMAPAMIELRTKLNEIARTQGLAAAFDYDAANNPPRIEQYKRHPEQKEKARQKMLSMTVDSYINSWKAMGKQTSVTSRLSEIKVPAIIFLGEEDVGTAEGVKILNKGIANSQLVTIKGAGHSPHEDNPADFNKALLPFLAKVKW